MNLLLGTFATVFEVFNYNTRKAWSTRKTSELG